MAKRTWGYELHLAAGGKMVEFAGYDLPIEYKTGLAAEHMAVRKRAGLFDVSHMGEFLLTGTGARAWLNRVLTNSFDSLKPGRVRYSVMCNELGGCLDDLIVYCISDQEFLLVVNAANREKDWAWLNSHLTKDRSEDPADAQSEGPAADRPEGLAEDVVIEDQSEETGLLALQGPLSAKALALISDGVLPVKNYSFSDQVRVAGVVCRVARTGYTGEYGFEIFLRSPEDLKTVWNALLGLTDENGEALVVPAGLGARDTLRLEAGMPLYGHEMDETVNPLEAALDFAVKLDKDFVGRDAIQASLPLKRRRVGLVAIDKGIAREHCPIFFNGEEVGQTTSGTYAPYLERAVAMALAKTAIVEVGTIVDVQVRKRMIKMEVVELPFYKAAK